MKLLNETDAKDLYDFLHYLKKSNWYIDLWTTYNNKPAIGLIYEWHYKVTGYVSAYDEFSAEDQLCKMTKDLADYFKKDIVIIKKKVCSRCRKSKDLSLFFSKKICKVCYKKKTHARRNGA